MIQRRAFLTGLASALAAPAIVRAASLMPVRGIVMDSGLTVYGKSPGMLALYDNRLMHKLMVEAMWRMEENTRMLTFMPCPQIVIRPGMVPSDYA